MFRMGGGGKAWWTGGMRVRILLVAWLATVPALLVLVRSAAEQKRRRVAEVQREALALARFTASNLDRDIDETRTLVRALGRALPVSGPGASACAEFLRELSSAGTVYQAMGVADSAGRVLCAGAGDTLPGLRDLPWFRAARDSGRLAMGGWLSRDRNRGALAFALPMGGFRGDIVFVALGMEWLQSLAARSDLPPGWAMSLADARGVALARYPEPELWVGKAYADSDDWYAGGGATEGLVERRGLDGKERFYAYALIKGGFLAVRLGLPKEAVFADANRALRRHLAWLAVVGAVAILAAWFGGEIALLRQVRALVAATRRLAAGDLTARSGLRRDQGELGELAGAFDDMAESLEWRDAQLRESERERLEAEDLVGDVEAADDAIVICDGDLSITMFNRGAERLFGYRAGDMLGHSLAVLFAEGPDLGGGALLPLLESPGDSALGHTVAVRGRRQDGRELGLELSLSKSARRGKARLTAVMRPRALEGQAP